MPQLRSSTVVRRMLAFGGSHQAHNRPPIEISEDFQLNKTRVLAALPLPVKDRTRYVVAYNQVFRVVSDDTGVVNEAPIGQPFNNSGRLYLMGRVTTLAATKIREQDQEALRGLSVIGDLPANTPLVHFPDGQFEFCGHNFPFQLLPG